MGVEAAHHVVRTQYDQTCAAPDGLAQQASGVFQLVGCAKMEGHFRHLFSARAIKNSTSSPTGRPVAPFAAPLFQAVPAMSRCAQGYWLVKRCKNLAAVIAPPMRPATLATSAKLVLRPSA